MVKLCLVKAASEGMVDIAFTALGTGRFRFDPNDVSYSMYKVAVQWANSNQQTTLKHIKFVLHDEPVHTAFERLNKTLLLRTEHSQWSRQETSVDDSYTQHGSECSCSSPYDAYDYVAGNVYSLERIYKTQPARLAQWKREPAQLWIRIWSVDESYIVTCRDALCRIVKAKLCTYPIHSYQRIIQEISYTECCWLEKEAPFSKFVDVSIDPRLGHIVISGHVDSTMKAVNDITTILLERQKEKNIAKTAEHVAWRYIDYGEFRFTQYDPEINYKLECEKNSGNEKCEITRPNGKRYIVNFNLMKESNIDDSLDWTYVERRTPSMNGRPSHWVDSPDKTTHLVTLFNGEPEYNRIVQMLREDYPGPFVIKKIERIQNLTMYRQYQHRLQKVMTEKSHIPKERLQRRLWFGANEEEVKDIQDNGFNRSKVPKSKGKYGDGVYFSRTAIHILNHPTPKGYLILAKVITGCCMEGRREMKVLDKIDVKTNVEYDCAVDDIHTPETFVIFHDASAYPEYIVKYSKRT